jgi:hypothetical protein
MDNPFPICIDDDIVSHFSNFVDLEAKKTFHTNTDISFSTIPFGAKFSTLKGKKNPERFNIYQFSEEYTVKIKGYADVILGYTVRELYFLANDVFVMGEYVFDDVSKANNKNLINKLIEIFVAKYNIAQPPKDEIFLIRDNKDSLICFINSGFTISIQFINLKHPFVDEILKANLQRGTLSDVDITVVAEEDDFSKL